MLRTAHRLLCLQCRLIANSLPGAVAAHSATPLHDLRVAIRRLCAVLRAFRKPLAGTAAARLAEPFAQLNAELGPLRDADVWLAYLRSRKIRRQLKRAPSWPAYLAACEAARQQTLADQRRLLGRRAVKSLLKRAAHACRVELPRMIRARHHEPIRPFAADQLKRLFDFIAEHKDVKPGASPDDLHTLRKRCRRGRYCAEFFAPVLGPMSDDLARRFKRLADPLGRIHDVDVALERIAQSRVPPPRQLLKILRRRRTASWKKFRKAWTALRRRKFIKRVARNLSADGTGSIQGLSPTGS